MQISAEQYASEAAGRMREIFPDVTAEYLKDFVVPCTCGLSACEGWTLDPITRPPKPA